MHPYIKKANNLSCDQNFCEDIVNLECLISRSDEGTFKSKD